MTVSYLDTVAAVEAASTQGLAYAKLTRAMKVHVRSLVTEGHAAAFIGDEEVALNEPKAHVCITDKGVAYVELLQSSGLIVSDPAPAPKRKRSSRKQPKAAPAKTAKPKRRNNPVTVSKRVPTPVESVTSPVLPEGETARRVPGNQHGDQLKVDQKVDQAAQIEDLERKVSALMAVIAS
jgi:hypothetical protein